MSKVFEAMEDYNAMESDASYLAYAIENGIVPEDSLDAANKDLEDMRIELARSPYASLEDLRGSRVKRNSRRGHTSTGVSSRRKNA